MLYNFINKQLLSANLLAFLDEDLGSEGDISSILLLNSSQKTSAEFRTRSDGVLAGLSVIELLVELYNKKYNSDLQLLKLREDGQAIHKKDLIAEISGNYHGLLAVERTALNLLCFLSGIASETAKYVSKIKHTRVEITDSRKTHPGLRLLSKYAVACGGGVPNRFGLYDAVLWKDNHIAAIPLDQLQQRISSAISSVRSSKGLNPKFIELEVDTLEQFYQVVHCDLDYIMLDNMPPAELKQAVAFRDKHQSRVKLEASGGINLETLVAIAETGVDRISVGALTHSVRIIDIGLDAV
jgi:nicotinate-nucleotide pyrophosphorylase (carboxylating)